MPRIAKPHPTLLGAAAAKAIDFESPAPDDVLQIAREAADRVRGRSAQVRLRFLQRQQPEDEKPPLARMVKGGQGGAAKLKLMLTLLWIGSGKGHDIAFPAHSYARLFGFEDPYANGARRIRDAIDWLEAASLVAVERRPGREPVITLRREDGSGVPYEVPGGAAKDGKKKTLPINHYVRLPEGFWTRGWASYLDAPAVTMLLVLLAKAQNKRASGIWISPRQLADWYGFSDDTRQRGVAALEECGLICVSRVPVDPNFGTRRVRNQYAIEPALLDKPIDVHAKTRWSPAIDVLGQSPYAAWSAYVEGRLTPVPKES